MIGVRSYQDAAPVTWDDCLARADDYMEQTAAGCHLVVFQLLLWAGKRAQAAVDELVDLVRDAAAYLRAHGVTIQSEPEHAAIWVRPHWRPALAILDQWRDDIVHQQHRRMPWVVAIS